MHDLLLSCFGALFRFPLKKSIHIIPFRQIKGKCADSKSFSQIKVQQEKRTRGISFLAEVTGSSSVFIELGEGPSCLAKCPLFDRQIYRPGRDPKSLSGHDLWAKLPCSPSARSSQCITEHHPSQRHCAGHHGICTPMRTCWPGMLWLLQLRQWISCWKEIKTEREKRNLEKCPDEKSRTELCALG